MKPTPAKPRIIIVQVEGSGTAALIAAVFSGPTVSPGACAIG
jgi:hypothetical protein